MCKNNYVLYIIEQLKAVNPETPSDGYFQSIDDRAYRLEAVRQIFCGLERNRQDEVLRYAMKKLLGQNAYAVEWADSSNKMLLEALAVNGKEGALV